MFWRAAGSSTSLVRMLNFAPCHGRVTCDRAFRQRPTLMGAGVLEGVEVAINVEQGEPLAVDFDPSGLTGREFVCLGDFQKLSHRLILQILGPPPVPNHALRANRKRHMWPPCAMHS